MWANPFPGGMNPMMQQSAIQGMPHGQVDWAQLAKQWIQHKETADSSQANHGGVDLAQPPPPPPPMPQNDDMEVVNEGETSQDSNSNSMYSGGNTEPTYTYPGQTGWNWNTQWNAQGWSVQGGENKDEGTFEYSHGNFGEQFEYNHGGQFYDQGDQGEYNNQYWNSEEHENHHYHRPRRDRNNRRDRERFRHNEDSNPSDDSGIDAAKRKSLPAWIREGLEKMENEKQRKLHKEKMDLEMQEEERLKEEREKAAKEAIMAQKEGLR